MSLNDRSHPPAVAALQQLHRIKTLELKPILVEELPLLAAFDAPYLRSLTLRRARDHHLWSHEALITLPRLFNGIHPLLTELFLDSVLRIGPNCFAQLTKLVLHGQFYVDSADLHSVLDLLEGSPQLADLAFTHCGTAVEDDDLASWGNDSASSRIPLVHLRRLTVIPMLVPLVGALLRCLELSQREVVTLLLNPGLPRYKLRCSDLGAMSQLPILGPFWSDLVGTAERMRISVTYISEGWDFTLAS